MEQKLKRYRLLQIDGEHVGEVNSFSTAVAVARENNWNVFDKLQKRLVYDGTRDDLCVYHTIDASDIERIRDRLTELLEKGVGNV